MRKQYPLADLRARSERWPNNRAAYILAHGKIEGDVVVVDDELQKKVAEKFPRRRRLPQDCRQQSFNIAKLRSNAQQRPPGYVDFILMRGKIEGDVVILDEAAFKELRAKFHRPKFNFGSSRRYNIAYLQSIVDQRPPGYVEFIMRRGRIDGTTVVLDEAGHEELRKRFPAFAPRPQPATPTLVELAGNFSGAMGAWAKAGFKVVEHEEYERRHAICLACEYWKPDALFGFGKCNKCGCSKFKLWLATSRCPDQPPRW